jgi:hypothetical protein
MEEEPVFERGLSREDSVTASQAVYTKPVTKKQYGNAAKRTKTRSSGR